MRIIINTFIIGFTFFTASAAHAAVLYWVPAVGEWKTGDTLTADLKIDSEGVGINATQATIRFPQGLLETTSINKNDSAFSFWLEEPSFSNTAGTISFVGGTPYGVSGASIKVLTATFTIKGPGTASLTASDAAITASDGAGTNVLSKTIDATYTLTATREATSPLPSKTTTEPTVVTPPQQIVRPVVPAERTPKKPVVRIALYPNTTMWHNVSNIFTANWDLPRDVTEVSTEINNQPNFQPRTSKGLFDSQSFPALQDGTWYLHVRFRNTEGWGETAHERLTIDTKAPLPFTITSSESESSENPSPVLSFKTSDPLSGIAGYQIRINSDAWVTIPLSDFTGSWKIAPLAPGVHQITVRALDRAGNSIESSISQETLPITSPSIIAVTEQLFSDETKGLTVQGTALPSTEIILTLTMGAINIEERVIPVDMRGNWEYTYGEPLRNGTYKATVVNRDMRGARSLAVESADMHVMERPILQLGKVSIGKNGAIALLLLLIAGGFTAGYIFFKSRREKIALRVSLAESDAAKIFNVIDADIDKVDHALSTETPADDEFAVKKLRENAKKMSGYLKKAIGRTGE